MSFGFRFFEQSYPRTSFFLYNTYRGKLEDPRARGTRMYIHTYTHRSFLPSSFLIL